MKAVLVNYNYTPDWLKTYNFDLTLYDRSDDGMKRDIPGNVIKTENRGNVDFDKLNYLIDNYDTLPDVFLWGKSNMFKYIEQDEFDKLLDNKKFTPLLSKNHKTYMDRLGLVCFYDGYGMYNERNDSWYLYPHPAKFQSYGQFAAYLNLPSPPFLAFAPGGNYILTREVVHKYSKDLYQKMADLLPYTTLPGEAHMLERTYWNLWRI